MIEPKAVRVKDAAKMLGVGIKQVYRYIESGKLAFIPGIARHSPRLILIRDIDTLLEKQKVTVHPPPKK